MKKTIIYDKKIIELAVIQEGNWDIYYCKENKQFYYIAKKELLDQNYASANIGYSKKELNSFITPEFIYKDLDVDAGTIYGCIQCYEYQACETDDYFESKLHFSLVRLKDAMLKRYIRNENLKIPYGYNGYDVGA